MKIFTIDSDNNITVHATRKSARASRLCVFDSAETLAAQIGPHNKRLVEIWNGLTGVTPVTQVHQPGWPRMSSPRSRDKQLP